MRIFVIAAHPDDEVLGCGATMAKLAEEGHEVYCTILGEGITSRYEKREDADQELIDMLHSRSRSVSELLGVKQLFLYKLPDNRFDTVPLLDVVKIIEDLIDSLKPDVIYTHHGGDLNIDHAIVNRATLIATRPTENHCVKEIYAYEVPSSTEWAFQQFQNSFKPNVFVDIFSSLDKKIKGMELYESEARNFPHPRSGKALSVKAQNWGSAAGLQYAEAFELIRSIRK